MTSTQVRGSQILDNTIQRQDIDTTTAGQALILKLIAGADVSISSTGVDAGTGDVTLNITPLIQTWVPTLGTLSGSYGITTINHAVYITFGTLCFFTLNVTGTTVGNAAGLTFTLPVAPVNTTTIFGGSCYYELGVGTTNTTAGYWKYSGAGSVVNVTRGGSNWTNGAGRLFIVQGFYQTV